MSEIRLTWQFNQPLVEGYSTVRLSYTINQPVIAGYSKIRLSWQFNQPLIGGYSTIHTAFYMLQTLHPVLPDGPMSTDPFPGFGNSTANPAIPAGADPASTELPGLAFSVHKKPRFKTRISEAASGNEVRNALAEYPRWDFELTYEFLEDRSGAESSLRTIMGFFLQRQGSYDSWLFKDPDDYLVTAGVLGTADGVTTEFFLARTMGGFSEIVGQVDTVNTISVFGTPTESSAIPGTPYEITVSQAASYVADVGVTIDGTPATKVVSGPTTGQYSVNETTGVYTFAAADTGKTAAITYRYTIAPANYTVTVPNSIVFGTAPASGLIISASFQFYFACRFAEDMVDFEKFYDKLWSLQECSFRSIIQ